MSDATEAAWDVLVVGAGMGGAATAYGLAERGLRVLVIERGHETHSADAPPITDKVDDPDARLAAGRWPDRIGGRLDGHAFDFFAPLGSGVGGSTLLYAAALDRFRACDFAPRTHPDGGTLAWPVAFDEFRHWYAKAETALGVTGSADPLDIHAQTDHLDPPAPLGPRDSDLARRFQAAGLHPYRLHCGFRDGTDCGACLGNLCPSGCKRHAGNRFLAPAQATGRVAVLSEAEVLRFEASETRVEAVTLRVAGETRRLSVPVFVLAAGALVSPALLLRSTSPAWPDGLGNRHDQVGRHLMFHTSRSLAVWSTRAHPHRGPGKSLVLRDFYDTPQGKFGEMQSVGLDAS
ncbi:MAG: GMC family oxidoreductase, partial [Maritimibacter sp.]|nr:GMC family oxidoreductase [Maritimibacter sp.]